MSAALDEKEAKKAARKKVRKRREVARRRIVNLPDDYSWWLENNLDRLGYANVPQAIRELSRIGLLAGMSVSDNDIAVAYKKHQLEKLHAEIEAMEGEGA